MAKILSIDYGTKRTGIAVTDDMQIIASGLTTVATSELHTFLEKYLKEELVETIVIGEPKQMNGEDSEVGKEIHAFAKALSIKYPNIQVDRQDERFTSELAFQAMITGGLGKKRRKDKALIDQVSATLILQGYMQRKNK